VGVPPEPGRENKAVGAREQPAHGHEGGAADRYRTPPRERSGHEKLPKYMPSMQVHRQRGGWRRAIRCDGPVRRTTGVTTGYAEKGEREGKGGDGPPAHTLRGKEKLDMDCGTGVQLPSRGHVPPGAEDHAQDPGGRYRTGRRPLRVRL